MRIVFLLVATMLTVSVATAQLGETDIIPRPSAVTLGSGQLTLNERTRIVAIDEVCRPAAETLRNYLSANFGLRLKIVKKEKIESGDITFLHQPIDKTGAEKDKYQLKVLPNRMEIKGTPTGQFYALKTLFQLFRQTGRKAVQVRETDVLDAPRLRYRGMHLDVSRHFMPVEFVKRYIDLMSQYKFNYFHWHLTDDQGWRIEIKKYPKLTEIGSKRSESHEGVYSTIFKGDGRPVEGFYTQEQIKDVVAYAKERYITVVPEIELPGHASAALAAYPELGNGCAAPNYKFEVKKTWGIFKEVFCPTDATFKFLEDVLDETIALFPDSPYIHIGGDEVLKDFWKESAFVQELKKRENLKDEHEVQSYFVQRIEKHVNKRGKKIIGWDEILEGGLAPNATVMSWRGMKGGIEAAKAKHDVIMTPTDYVYFDYGQGDPAHEPLNIGGYVPLEKVYSFEPVPKELSPDEAKYIIGGQANIWTEYLETPAAVEYMAFPRMLALSEVLWSRPEDKNYADFLRRLNANLPRLDTQNVNYRIPEPAGLKNLVGTGKVMTELTPAVGTKVSYSVTPLGGTVVRWFPYTVPVYVNLAEGDVKTFHTRVTNAAGRESVTYAATLVGGAMRDNVMPNLERPGVSFEFVVPSDDGERKTETGESRSIMLNQFAQKYDLKKPFGVTFDGYIKAERDEVYEFWVDSTWDATVVLTNNSMIINDAGSKDRKVKSAVVALRKGWHKVSLRYNHRGGDAHFRVRYGIKGQGLRQIYGGELVH